jgi:hypothetical protein
MPAKFFLIIIERFVYVKDLQGINQARGGLFVRGIVKRICGFASGDSDMSESGVLRELGTAPCAK